MKPKQNTLDQVENLPLDLSDEEQLALAQLIELSKEQGALSYEDIMTQVPEAEEMLPVIESLFDALQAAGIEITENGKVPTELEKIAEKVESSDSEDSV